MPSGVGRQEEVREYKAPWLLDAGPMRVFQFMTNVNLVWQTLINIDTYL